MSMVEVESSNSNRNEFEELLVVDNDMIEEVEAFIEENEEAKRLYFYKSPRLRQFWGDEQEELESWKELFFDLIYVAVAFSLGKTLEEFIVNDEDIVSAVYFFAQFSPLFGLWSMRMHYLSKFIPTSYFHGLLDVLYALFLALMAVFIASRKEIEASIGNFHSDFDDIDTNSTSSLFFVELLQKTIGFNTALGFSISALLGGCIHIFRCLEMMFVVSRHGLRDDIQEDLKKRQKQAILTQSKISLGRVVAFSMCMLLSVIGATIGDEVLFLVPLFVGFFISLLFHMILRIFWKKCFKQDYEIIPMNIGFVLKRLGEFTLLMLGEGILQIIITDVNSDNINQHFQTFILAFITQACLFVLIFYGLTFEPEEHAFRKSSISGMFVTLINPLMFCSIIGIGVGLKLVLKSENVEETTKRAMTNFLVSTVFFVLILRMINHGYYQIFRRDHSKEGCKDTSWNNVNYSRIIFSTFWLLLPFLYITLREVKMKNQGFLGSIIVIYIFVFIFGILEKTFFLKKDISQEEEQLFILSDEIRDKYEFQTKHYISQVQDDKSSLRTRKKRNFNCNVIDMLQYMRQKTRKITNGVNRAIREGNPENYEWEADVKDLEKLTKLLKDTFQGCQRVYSIAKQQIAEEDNATL